MNWLDPLGALLSLICTYYFTTMKRFAWLIGIAAITLNSILYWQKGIYGYLLLEGVYFLSMIYGYYHWSPHKQEKASRPIRRLDTNQVILLGSVAICGTFILGKLLSLTQSDIPYWDAATTLLSLMAQGLLCLRFIHCWILWFIVDALVGALQFYKGIPFHSAIHWMYLIFAILGYYRWRKIYIEQELVLS